MRKYLLRYKRADRINHWVVAVLFVCAGLSGLSLFHPSMFFFSNLFGGGPWTRILHPFLGLLMVLCFVRMYAHFWRDNVVTEVDRKWTGSILDLLRGDKSNMPPAGRYNAGQKAVFWTFAVSLTLLLITGFIFWRPWFVGFFPIWLIRIAVLVHAVSAFVLVITAIVHIYAAIWVRGTVRAMTRGTVTEAWARQNHPLWHAEMTRNE